MGNNAQVNALQAKLLTKKNLYLHFTSFLHIDMAEVVEPLPQVWQEQTYST